MKSVKISSVITNIKFILPFLAIVPLQKLRRSNLIFCKESSIDSNTVLDNLGKIDFKLEKFIESKRIPKNLGKLQFPKNKILEKIIDKENIHYLLTTESKGEFSLSNVIQPSIDNPKSFINLVSSNKETFIKYRETFRNYVNFAFNEDISKPFESDSISMIKSLAIGMQEFFENYCTELEINTNRNVIDYEFTPKINHFEREKLKGELKRKIQAIEDEIFKSKGSFKQISEKISDSINKSKDILKSAEVYREWPDNRLIYKNNQEAFTCLINEEDHLKMKMKTKNPSRMTKDILYYFDFIESLEKKVIFSYDKYFGYLNCLSSNLGNGTYYKIKLRIKDDPSLISEIRKKLKENIKDISIDILKEEGKAVIQLSNKNPYFGFSSILVEILGIKEYLERVDN